MYSFSENEMNSIIEENNRLKSDLKYKTEEVEDFKVMLKSSREAYNFINDLAIERSRKITDLDK